MRTLGGLRKPVVAVVLLLVTAAEAQEAVDESVLAHIREEGFQRSQVMALAAYMTDVLGPRVTSSRRMKKAQEWAKAKMDEIGLVRTTIEPFGEHEASWDNRYTSLHLVEPDYQPLIGYPYAFTPGTNGKVTAEARIAVVRTRADLERHRGKLRGAAVLAAPAPSVAPRFSADATRFSRNELDVHHSNMDVYDRLVPEDLRKNAVILATFLYSAATRDGAFPREMR